LETCSGQAPVQIHNPSKPVRIPRSTMKKLLILSLALLAAWLVPAAAHAAPDT